MPRPRAPRKYRLKPTYIAPDLVHAAVFATIATAKTAIRLPDLARSIGLSGAMPDEIAGAIQSLLSGGWIEERHESQAVRQVDGRVAILTTPVYRLGPKGAAHV